MNPDGYPDEAELARVRNWPLTENWRPLIDFVRARWALTDAPEPEVIDGATFYAFHTGGWSGNEDLIGALHSNPAFWLVCWERSHKGGKHVFRLPRP